MRPDGVEPDDEERPTDGPDAWQLAGLRRRLKNLDVDQGLLDDPAFRLKERMSRLERWGVVYRFQDKAVRDSEFVLDRDRYQLTETVAELHRAITSLGDDTAAAAAATLAPGILTANLTLLRDSAETDPAGAAAAWSVIATDEKMLNDWTEDGSGPGAGYEVGRDALLLMTSPDVLAAALHPPDADTGQLAATRTTRQLRALLETPAVEYAELSEPDADALRQARGLRSVDLTQLTGGTVEARTGGLVLVLPDDPDRQPTVADRPRARAADWVALLMADLAGRHGTRTPTGSVVLTDAQVDEVVDDLTEWRGEYMSKEQRTVPGTVRADAETILAELGLLRVGDDRTWTLSPVAGRYRDPDVTLVEPVEPSR